MLALALACLWIGPAGCSEASKAAEATTEVAAAEREDAEAKAEHRGG
jgi:hypothetical protein